MKHAIAMLLIVHCYYASGQQTNKNAIFVEGFGAGGWWSTNYERRIYSSNKYSLQIRAGIGFYRFRDYELKFNPDVTFPFAANFSLGKKHQATFELGQTLVNMIQLNAEDMAKHRTISLSAFAGIGYRLQATNGLLLKIMYVPTFERYKSFRHWAGISLGYSF